MGDLSLVCCQDLGSWSQVGDLSLVCCQDLGSGSQVGDLSLVCCQGLGSGSQAGTVPGVPNSVPNSVPNVCSERVCSTQRHCGVSIQQIYNVYTADI